MERKILQVTRPKLVSRLMEFGIKPTTITVNPWHPERTLWIFNVTTSTAQITRTFYEEIGKPVPKVIAEYLNEVR